MDKVQRKEWLEKFIELCDTGADTKEFRRHCRVKAQHMPRHVKKLGAYRQELAALKAELEPEVEEVEEETPSIEDSGVIELPALPPVEEELEALLEEEADDAEEVD